MTPSSEFNPCESAAGPPLPLISAYSATAVMKPWPTRNPTNNSSNQNERDAKSSRTSFATNCTKLGERKKDFLQPTAAQICLRLKFSESAFGDSSPVIQQHETITNLRRIVQLVNRE